MTEPRVYADVDLAVDATVTLPEGAYQHLIVVLRRVKGDAVAVFNGRGDEFYGAIDSVARREVSVRLVGRRERDPESPLRITLGQAVSKGDRMDFAIQKAVELGVTEIQPLVSDHVVVKLSEERWLRKQEHWQAVAVSAAEQSGRTRVPKVLPVIDLRDFIAHGTGAPGSGHTGIVALKLMLAPGAGTAPGALKHGGQPIHLLVGPEGGFSELELRLADLAGYTALQFGPRILRTETAGMVALAVLQSLWGDLGVTKKNR